MFVTGPWCGWCFNDVYNTMSDDDGDGIYTVAVTIDGVALGIWWNTSTPSMVSRTKKTW